MKGSLSAIFSDSLRENDLRGHAHERMNMSISLQNFGVCSVGEARQ